jgi:hypothetical protein
MEANARASPFSKIASRTTWVIDEEKNVSEDGNRKMGRGACWRMRMFNLLVALEIGGGELQSSSALLDKLEDHLGS